METIYLDNAATTRVRQEVVDAMLPYFTEEFGNPSSIYGLGQRASDAVRDARNILADAFNCTAKEVFFTSGGSEGDNWAIKGTAHAHAAKGKHIITSAVEHHAILHSCEALEKEGFEVTYLPVDQGGRVSVEDLKNALRDDTILVTIMLANNEIGTIMPIKELAEAAHAHGAGTSPQGGAMFHTDAVQAFAHMPVDVQDLGVDLMSVSGHKLHAPKGVGALYIRKGCKLQTFMDGGAQERGKRATTENVPGIVGFGKATELMRATLEEDMAREKELRDHCITRILSEIPHCKLNGDWEGRLVNNVNISFEFIEGEGMLLQMAGNGVCVSSGSACTSGSLDPSHVLLAIGLPHEIAHGSMRLTLDRDTTLADIDHACDSLVKVIGNLRAMSPLYEDFKNGNYESIIEYYKENGVPNCN
ncbi:MAG: cysteine desulfurase NifS [Phoenicibacter congonensis]|uniref:Cysteine desulfurase IscS n=1 Tax=Phoenicibacter congonensis TaxID=1944646 RepID=A0AA43U9V4_9ACTN|nr:cysteine desulfurase NifS [Phoenicibacter congonensis]